MYFFFPNHMSDQWFVGPNLFSAVIFGENVCNGLKCSKMHEWEYYTAIGRCNYIPN